MIVKASGFLLTPRPSTLTPEAWSTIISPRWIEFTRTAQVSLRGDGGLFMTSEIKADRVLDCRGLLCPMPIINTKRELASMAVGEVLEVLATDPGSRRDMPAFTKNTGQELIEASEDGQVLHYLIRKTR
jgi:tRNA 2-thiouridine synthesizing protein A